MSEDPLNPHPLSREELISGLRDLVAALRGSEQAVHLRLIGGAAITLVFDADRNRTVDIDGRLTPRDAVLDAAVTIGSRRGWPENWVNDAAAQFLPNGFGRRGEEWDPVYADGHVTVEIGSPEMLLAMKLYAAQKRGRREQRDIAVLAAACGITAVDEAEALFGDFYPGDEFSARTARIVQDALDSGYAGRPGGFPELG